MSQWGAVTKNTMKRAKQIPSLSPDPRIQPPLSWRAIAATYSAWLFSFQLSACSFVSPLHLGWLNPLRLFFPASFLDGRRECSSACCAKCTPIGSPCLWNPSQLLNKKSFGKIRIVIYMLVPKRANYQYRYGAAQYRYWYPYSNSLVFSFLSQFFQSTIEFTSLGSE